MRKIIRLIPVGVISAIVTALVAYFSLSANPIGAEEIMWFDGADKMWHFILYFIVEMVYFLDYAKFKLPHHTELNGEAMTLASAIVLSGVFELLQGLIGSRSMEGADLCANIFGAIAAFLFVKYYLITVFRKYMMPRRHHRHHSDNGSASVED